MNNHLTSQQVSEFVAGAASAAVEEHIRACPECRSESERLRETLGLFRQSVQSWAAEQEKTEVRTSVSRRKVSLRRLCWTLALAACLFIALTLPRDNARKPASPQATIAPITDAELLVQVNRQLSEAVPASMAPMELQITAGKKQTESQKQ